MANLSGGSVVWDLSADDSQLTAALNEARSQVNKAAKDIDGTMSGIGKSIARAFDQARDASFQFAAGLGAIGAAGIGAIGFGVKMAADIETARQGFVTLLGSAEKADEALAQIKRDASQTPFEFAGLVRANQLLTQVTKDAPRSERLLLNVGKALAAAGKGGEELDNVIVNLQQIANTSKISELDIRQFGFAGINILELLAEQYGVTKDRAADMVKNSSDAFADLEQAFIKAGEGSGKFSRAFIDQAGTFNQLASNLKDVLGQTAADIVSQTGIFDAVKNSLAGIVGALQQFQPQIVQGIKDFMEFMSANGPIVVGIIAGGLAPAFAALAVSIGSSVLALLPFIVIGAALGFIVQQVVTQLGGWEAVQIRLNQAFQRMSEVYNTMIKPALDSLWQTIQNQLLPPLRELWNQVSPILLPALEALGSFMATQLYTSFIVVIEVLKALITWVGSTIEKWNQLMGFFKGVPDAIKNAFSGVFNAITKPFEDAWNKVRDIANKIKGEMDKISPFHRNSPSLIDKVNAGVDIIKERFGSLEDIGFPQVSESVGPPSDFFNAGFDQGGGKASVASSSPNIVVNIGTVQNKSDIDMINREIGFRAALLPAT